MLPVRASRLPPPSSWSAIPHPLDVEESDVAGVLLDEVLAGLHLVPHQIGERLLDARGRRLVDGDALQRAAARVHRRLPELLGVHLAEALEAGQLHSLAGELE